MATTLGLDHLVLVVEDVERSLAWYGRHAGLGGVRVDEWRRGEAPFPSLRVDDTTIIDLVPRTPGEGGTGGGTGGGAGPDRGRLDHICFVVSEDDRARLAAELEVVAGPARRPALRRPRYGRIDLRARPRRAAGRVPLLPGLSAPGPAAGSRRGTPGDRGPRRPDAPCDSCHAGPSWLLR